MKKESCPDCERLIQEEAEAAMELGASDETLPLNVSIEQEQRARMRRIMAESRLTQARERLAAHRTVHHPQ